MYVCLCMDGGLQKWHIFVFSVVSLYIILYCSADTPKERQRSGQADRKALRAVNDTQNEKGSMKEKREVTLVVIGVQETKASGSILSQTLLLHTKDV